MNRHHEIVVTQDAPADAAAMWNRIAKIGGVNEWFPLVASCQAEGSGAGARRTCMLRDGAVLKEHVLSVDHDGRTIRYEIESGLPVTPMLNVMRIEAVGPKMARVTWSASFTASDEVARGLEPQIRSLYAMGIDGLVAAAT